jgi:ketosteroid isomerase-like protein
MITSFFLLLGCSNNQDSVEESASASNKSEYNGSSEIHREYPKEEKEVMETFGNIASSIINGAGKGYYGVFMDQLISFHAYGDNFTEFNNGELYDSAGNEHNERQLFGEDLEEWDAEANQFAAIPGTLKVAVYYGNVANLTFTSDFILTHKVYGEIRVNNLITLLFVKTEGEWKLVHEHHSPVNIEESGSASKSTLSKNSAISQSYTDEQVEVLTTFGAIAQSIMEGAGKGYDGEYMDQLISFHAYGRKFTEFNGGQSFDSAGNEHNERQLFGEDLEEWDYNVNKFAAKEGTLKVAVFNRNVANVTFISDFILTHKEFGEITVNNLITLLFVKIKGEWKIVHEHHSPAKV